MFSTIDVLFFYSYGITLSAINLRTIYILWTRRAQFSSVFYLIYAILSTNSFCLYLLNNYAVRLPTIPFFYELYFSQFKEWSRWNSIPSFFRTYCSYFNVLGCFFLSFNRCTAIAFYWKHEKWWTQNQAKWMFLFFVVPLIFAFQELVNQTKFLENSVNGTTYVQLVSDSAFHPINSMVSTISVMLAFCISDLVFNVVSLTLWHKMKDKIPIQFQAYEWRLLLTTVITYAIGLTTLSLFVVPVLYHIDAYTMFIAYLLVSDTVALLPPLVIMLMSPTLRSSFMPETELNSSFLGWLKPTVLINPNSRIKAVSTGQLISQNSRVVSLPDRNGHNVRHVEISHPNTLI